jgi:hypothetical protein
MDAVQWSQKHPYFDKLLVIVVKRDKVDGCKPSYKEKTK